MKSIEEYFNGKPAVQVSAPGRVNLLGEHTDYNDGFVLPIATVQRTLIALAASPDNDHHLYSATLDQSINFNHAHAAPPGFGRYVEGTIRILEETGVTVPPLKVYVQSNVPIGAGLSSSAALEVAVLRGLRALLGLALDDVKIALMAQQAEIRYAHVNCGIMDQMAASLADSEHMLFLDTRTLERQLLSLPAGSELVVIDTGVSHSLEDSAYNQRRSECEEAARLLGVRALRDISDAAAVAHLPEVLRRRARHVVNENNRVLEAARGIAAERFGILMNDSHFSLKDDYEVSVPALDCLSSLLRTHPDVFGARLTGAGFGGACVALCRLGCAHEVARQVLAQYNATGQTGRILLPEVAQQAPA